MNKFQKFSEALNKPTMMVLNAPGVNKLAGKAFVVVSYTGRKSGKPFSLPVNYKRTGDEIVIRAAMPDKKNWWRNFLGEGGPVTLALPEGVRTGTAVATRSASGSVSVAVTLD